MTGALMASGCLHACRYMNWDCLLRPLDLCFPLIAVLKNNFAVVAAGFSLRRGKNCQNEIFFEKSYKGHCYARVEPIQPNPDGMLPRTFFCGALSPSLASAADPPGPKERMYLVKVTHVCIITPQFAKMQEFYKRLLHLEPKQFQVDYVEFETPGAIVSLYEEASFAQIAPAAVPKPGTGGMMLELQVANVDQEFRRLHSLGLKSEHPPAPHDLSLGQPLHLPAGPRRQSHQSL